MSGLILKLRAHEQVLVNGVVMQNGDRNARLVVKTPDAKILRLRDAIHPDEVDTPVKRVCYIAQLLVSGSVSPATRSGSATSPSFWSRARPSPRRARASSTAASPSCATRSTGTRARRRWARR